MSVTIDSAASVLSRRRGFAVDNGKVALALAGIDQDAALQAARERLRWERWDQETPINGAAPELILSRPDYQGGEIYLIYVDDALTFLQPHRPDDEGLLPISTADLNAVAAAHVEELADRMAAESVIEDVDQEVARLEAEGGTRVRRVS